MELQWLFSFFGSGIILRRVFPFIRAAVMYNTLQRAMRIVLVTWACATTKVWFQEKANAFVIFSWNLLQDMFSGIFSSSILPPSTVYSMQTVWERGVLSRVGDHILQDSTLCMWPDSELQNWVAHPKT
jgi:hypothetical protein